MAPKHQLIDLWYNPETVRVNAWPLPQPLWEPTHLAGLRRLGLPIS